MICSSATLRRSQLFSRPATRALISLKQVDKVGTDAKGAVSQNTVGNVNELEICGVGRIEPDPEDPNAYSYVDGVSKKTQGRWLSAMAESGDYRARAAGSFLSGWLSDRERQPMGQRSSSLTLSFTASHCLASAGAGFFSLITGHFLASSAFNSLKFP
jgi:hypothetical protein